MRKYLVLAIMMLMVLSTVAFAAEAVKLSVEPFMEQVLERKVTQDEFSGKISQGWYGTKVDITLLDKLTVSPFIAGVGTGGKFEGEKIEADSSFGYGLAVKADLPLNLPVDISLLSMIRATKTDLNKVGEYELSYNKDVDFLEYEFEAQVAKTLEIPNFVGKITPMIGVRYSDVKITGSPDMANIDLASKNNIGMSVGAKYDYNDTFGISVKAKLIDQTAIVVAGTIKF